MHYDKPIQFTDFGKIRITGRLSFTFV